MSREAFEAWYEQYRENACTLYGAIDCIHPEDIAFASWRAGWQAARAAALEEATADSASSAIRNREAPANALPWVPSSEPARVASCSSRARDA